MKRNNNKTIQQRKETTIKLQALVSFSGLPYLASYPLTGPSPKATPPGVLPGPLPHSPVSPQRCLANMLTVYPVDRPY